MHLLKLASATWILERKQAGVSLSIEGVSFLEPLQHPDFDFACVAVLGDGSNDLDCNPCVGFGVYGLDYLSESPLTKETNSPVYGRRQSITLNLDIREDATYIVCISCHPER